MTGVTVIRMCDHPRAGLGWSLERPVVILLCYVVIVVSVIGDRWV